MKKISKLLALALCVCLVLSLAACGGGDGDSGDTTTSDGGGATDGGNAGDGGADDGRTYGDPIKLGLTTPVTGEQAAGGEMARHGSEIRIGEINDAGGIQIGDTWHLVELIIEDDQGNSDTSLNTVRKLVSDGAVAILGPYFSGQTIALADTMNELQVPLVNSATSVNITDLENDWLWRCRCDDGINVEIIAKAVVDDGATKVAIMCANDETGTAAAAGYQAYFERNNIDFYVEWHTSSDTDLTAQISKALAEGCDAWVGSTHDQAAVALAKGMYDLGLRDQTVYLNPILAQTQVLDMMEPEWVEGWRCVSDFSYTDSRPEQANFTAKFVDAYGVNPDVQAALYYSHVTVVCDAIARAQSTDSVAIRDAIAATDGLVTLVGTAYAAEYTNLMWEISINEIQDLTPVIVGSVSVAGDYGFGS